MDRTSIYSPEQNGIAERLNCTLAEMTRALLIKSGLSQAFWGEAVLTVMYTKSCSLYSSIPKSTPFEQWFG